MKHSDIKTGVEYALSRDNYGFEQGRARRVRVTDTEASIKEGRGRYGTKSVRGIAVKYLNADGTVLATGVVPTRQIREEWATYDARWDEIRLKRREREAETRREQDARARRLLHIIPALRHSGLGDTSAVVSNDVVRGLLETHVPDVFVLNDDGGTTSRIRCPLADSIKGYVASDKAFEISADDLMKLAR